MSLKPHRAWIAYEPVGVADDMLPIEGTLRDTRASAWTAALGQYGYKTRGDINTPAHVERKIRIGRLRKLQGVRVVRVTIQPEED